MRSESTVSKKQQKKARSPSKPIGKVRNACLDTLRGIAILLMIVDHIAAIVFDVRIEPNTIRIATRLSMPLFCILMGYFLASPGKTNWNRFFQIVLATIAINLVYFTVYRQVEILASLLVCYVLFLLVRAKFAVAVLAVYLFPWDLSVGLFDYPLTVVASCVAQGMVLRQWGLKFALLSAAIISAGGLVVTPPTWYVLLFVIPATLLIGWGAGHAGRSVTWLAFVGRYPLSFYLAQYYILLAIGPRS